MDIRYSRGLDEMNLNRWLKDPRVQSTSPCRGEEEIRNFSRSWMFYAHKKAGLSVISHDVNLGMGVFILMPYQKVMHHALLQIIIDPEYHNKGLGGTLLKNMLHLAKNYLNLEIVFMEYFGPKHHLDFFLKRGFKVYAIQKGYVEGSYPDKYLLECVL
jgi:ribosomal protein S18 acetylase RimI-like enzyme